MAQHLVFVVVNSEDDYLTRRKVYEGQGYTVSNAHAFNSIKIDLQDYNGTDIIITDFHAFEARRTS